MKKWEYRKREGRSENGKMEEEGEEKEIGENDE